MKWLMLSLFLGFLVGLIAWLTRGTDHADDGLTERPTLYLVARKGDRP